MFMSDDVRCCQKRRFGALSRRRDEVGLSKDIMVFFKDGSMNGCWHIASCIKRGRERREGREGDSENYLCVIKYWY